LAFTRKATLEALSYRAYLVLSAAGGLVTLASLFYLGHLVGPSTQLPQGYFAFTCVGLAAYLPSRAAQAELARQVRAAQMVGLLEPLAAAPAALPAQLCALAVPATLAALGGAALTLTAGVVLFGLRIDLAGIPAAAAAFCLAAAASTGLGLLSSAVVLHVRRSDPVAYLLDAAAWLASGLLFPVSLLPPWARAASFWIPATHALRAARGALLMGAAPADSWLPLCLLACLALGVGSAALTVALRAARRSGALGIS
ncbi:MAG TPA: ABC transporter permease, partial [Myxococcales bacterium]|nr:ABC transporter permease [Myxococcales bacterium]